MDQQTLRTRRLVAAGAVVLVVVLLVLLIKSCADSRREQALKDYNRNVRTLVQDSKSTVSRQLFDALASASGQQGQQVQEQVNQLQSTAQEELDQAKRLDVPDAMKEAQTDLVLALSLRHDGVQRIADLIQTAVGSTAGAADAVNEIAGQMRAFDASDVIYSQRVAPLILRGLKDDGIAASYDGTAGERVLPEASFLPANGISWISPAYVASQLGASAGATVNGKPAPGLHGHQLDSVSVGGTTLDPSGSNQLQASPPPAFTVMFTNGGDNDETNVRVTVEISGAGAPIKAQAVVPSTTAHQQSSAQVDFTKAPPTSGPVTITVTIEKVPGEETTDNNTQTYTALFV